MPNIQQCWGTGIWLPPPVSLRQPACRGMPCQYISYPRHSLADHDTPKLRRHISMLLLQYVQSVFTFSDTNKTATNGEEAWQSH